MSGSKYPPVECQDAIFDQHDNHRVKDLADEQIREKVLLKVGPQDFIVPPNVLVNPLKRRIVSIRLFNMNAMVTFGSNSQTRLSMEKVVATAYVKRSVIELAELEGLHQVLPELRGPASHPTNNPLLLTFWTRIAKRQLLRPRSRSR